MCAWNFTFFALILLQNFSSFASSTSANLPPSPSLSCFPLEAEVSVKERLEDWLSKVFGESFPFEKEPRVEEGGESKQEDRVKEDGHRTQGKEEVEDIKGGISRLRGKTGFFELDKVL